MKRLLSWLLLILVVALFLGAIHSCMSITHIDKHECGFTFDRFTGEVEPLERDGFVYRVWPKYSVHAIDGRPQQIRITADLAIGDRVLNAKLVRFDPAGIEEFVEWHGRKAGDSIYNLREIFKCYAFAVEGEENCPFIDVTSESTPMDVVEIYNDENQEN